MKNILIMEDQPDQAFLLQYALVNMHFLTVACHNTFRAIEMIRGHEFDVIVTDLRMPEMGGFEFIKYIRMIDKEIPIVVITACVSVEGKSDAFKYGANYFIEKPFSKQDIINVFKQWQS
jgi:DNA-binding NtrC family response regulator